MSKKNKKNDQANPVKKQNAQKKQPANMKNNNILTRFFSHNITLMVLSFLLAFSIWFMIVVNSETDSSVTVSGIPVSIELSDTAQQEGLEVFLTNELKASVEVSGNRVTVGSLSADDIAVYATQTGSIIAPGTYTLPLNAKKAGIKNNYEIVSAVTPSSITIRVDRRVDDDPPVESRISVQNVDSNHYGDVTLKPDSIHISGPESQVNRIAKVVASASLAPGTSTVKVKYLDAESNELNLPLVTADVDEVEATITVLPVKEVNLKLDTLDVSCPKISISPKTIKLAGDQESLDKIQNNQLVIGQLDFSTLRNEKYSKTFAITAPDGCKIITNDKSKEQKAEVTIDLTSYSMRSINCSIKSGLSDKDAAKYDVSFVSDTVTVDVYGPSSLIDKLTAADLSAVADFSDYLKDTTLSVPAVPVKVTINNNSFNTCWVYGTYTAAASITKK